MLNTLEAYSECGRGAATAQNQRDTSRYDFHRSWLNRALSLEKPDDKSAAKAAYEAAYKETRVVPNASYFL